MFPYKANFSNISNTDRQPLFTYRDTLNFFIAFLLFQARKASSVFSRELDNPLFRRLRQRWVGAEWRGGGFEVTDCFHQAETFRDAAAAAVALPDGRRARTRTKTTCRETKRRQKRRTQQSRRHITG